MSPPPELLPPLHVFRFQVDFKEDPLGAKEPTDSAVPLCVGSFAECGGIEASMEPKEIKEGGRNYGSIQRAGRTTFSTVMLKRGMTSTRHLWTWFELMNARGAYAYRLAATITLCDNAGRGVIAWTLRHALPVKLKVADLNARGTDVGIEELHIAHESLEESTSSLLSIPNESRAG